MTLEKMYCWTKHLRYTTFTMSNNSPDVKIKRNTKCCKQCSKQVPTACKTCSCGFCFRKTSPTDSPETAEGTSAGTDGAEVTQRRTQRTRRERPHFFDSLEYGAHFRKRKNLSSSGILDHAGGIKRKAEWKQTSSSKPHASPTVRNILSGSASVHLISTSAANHQSPAKDSSSSLAANGGGAYYSNGSNGCNEEDVYNELSVERLLQYSIVLAEINRKCMGVSCQPG